MNKLLGYIATSNGYDSTDHMVNNIFHPSKFEWMATISSLLASFSYVFENIFGIHAIVAMILIILFFLEMHTGIKASRREGKGFQSSKFPKGWFKLGVYGIMIGSMNLCSVYIPHREFLGFDINIYSFLHYAFYNFIIINLFISNVENFVRLGWDMGGFIPWIAGKMDLKVFVNKDIDKEK
mgnify:FL=1|tara:strand:+ start:321 stop:863 length:543 start_codon:yes stop_codon:yes gene_type:complete